MQGTNRCDWFRFLASMVAKCGWVLIAIAPLSFVVPMFYGEAESGGAQAGTAVAMGFLGALSHAFGLAFLGLFAVVLGRLLVCVAEAKADSAAAREKTRKAA